MHVRPELGKKSIIIVVVVFKIIFWSLFCWRMQARRRAVIVVNRGVPVQGSTVVCAQTGEPVGVVRNGWNSDRSGIINNEVPPVREQPGRPQPPSY